MDLLLVDLIRAIHLLCLALGMGTALYLDARTFRGIASPLTRATVAEMHRIHRTVSFAFAGLWVSGFVLIGIRTGFDLAAFSPKLWCKIIVVSAMTANAIVLARRVLPLMERSLGRRIVDLPTHALAPLAVVGGVSIFSWLSALALGSSVVLKAASWGVLAPALALFLAATLVGSFAALYGLRALLAAPRDPFERLRA